MNFRRLVFWQTGSYFLTIACLTSTAMATLYDTFDRPIPGTESIRLSTGVDLSGLDLENLDAGNASLRNASLVGTNLQYARLVQSTLTGANFSNANIRQANLGGISREQIYSTASYQNQDLYGVSMRPPSLPEGETWDLSGQNLHAAFLVDDFRDADFSNADLRNAGLTGDFVGANWTNSQLKNIHIAGDFSNTNWSERDLSNARLSALIAGSDFSGSNFTNARFGDTFRGCLAGETPCGKFGNPDYANVDFSNAIIHRATFAGPTLSPEQFYSTANYQAGDLREIRIVAEGSSIFLNPAIVDGWDFSNQDLTDAFIVNSSSRDADFSNAQLVRSDLIRTDFSGANFNRANLAFAKMSNTELMNTNFEGANLSYATLYGADLSSPGFEYANLVGADLEEVNIAENTQVNVTGAKLQNAVLTDVDLSNFIFDATTEFNQWTAFPNGFMPEDAGLTYRSTEPGDLNANGIIDANDITIMATRLRNRPAESRGGSYASKIIGPFDFVRDGTVDDADLQVLLELANAIPGDTDLSGSVTFYDFLVLSKNFGQAGGWEEGDFDGNGSVAFRDFTALSASFGRGASSEAAAVPEPGSQYLAPVGLLALFHLTRRSRLANQSIHAAI